jgi:DNA-binding NtrC family response regulator
MLENGRVLSPRCPGCEDARTSGRGLQTPSLQPNGAVSAAPPEEGGRRYASLPISGMSMDELEKELIVQALVQYQGNQTDAAKHLGISRDTIRYRIKKYKLAGFGKDANDDQQAHA